MRLAPCAALVLLAGCGAGQPFGPPKACTLIGCEDQFTATLAQADGALPSGPQTLTVAVDGATATCSFTLPLASGAGFVDCPNGLQLLVRQAENCATTMNAQTATLTCTPVPGQFSEELTIVGKPATVHVTQTSNGATLVDAAVTPSYQKSQPNGAGCDPICSQASESLVLAPK